MRDKLVPMFEAATSRRRLDWQPARLEREMWTVGPEVYLLNADPDLARNLATCLAVHFRSRGVRLTRR
jgi:hypothetical protein